VLAWDLDAYALIELNWIGYPNSSAFSCTWAYVKQVNQSDRSCLFVFLFKMNALYNVRKCSLYGWMGSSVSPGRNGGKFDIRTGRPKVSLRHCVMQYNHSPIRYWDYSKTCHAERHEPDWWIVNVLSYPGYVICRHTRSSRFRLSLAFSVTSGQSILGHGCSSDVDWDTDTSELRLTAIIKHHTRRMSEVYCFQLKVSEASYFFRYFWITCYVQNELR